jgi:hypothetical protein
MTSRQDLFSRYGGPHSNSASPRPHHEIVRIRSIPGVSAIEMNYLYGMLGITNPCLACNAQSSAILTGFDSCRSY